MAITASTIKELREKTGAGMMACKTALKETNGDFEAAVDYLRKKGLAAAEKKQSRTAAEGIVVNVVEGNKAVILEVNCETDFVAKGDGSHYFSATLKEHQAAVRKYQIKQRRADYRSAPASIKGDAG